MSKLVFADRHAHGRRAPLWLLAGLAALTVQACGETTKDDFQTNVLPVLENRCASAACHGVPTDQVAKMKLDEQQWLTFRIDSAGRITDIDAARNSAKAKVNSREGAAFSTLLRKTLPVAQGGTYHYKREVFGSRDDPDYRALAAWAASLPDGGEASTEPALNANETMFQNKVYPLLVQRGCATATCHGSLMFGGTVFDAPPVPGQLALPKAALRKTYGEARRNITLWGEPLKSRLIAKMLPLNKGGIPHKGGNDMFFAKEVEAGQDPRDAQAIKDVLAWMDAERKADPITMAPTAQPPLIAVGGPLPAAGPFEVQPFTPGSDLYRLDPPYTGKPVNLTAALHNSPADIRDPAVSHDGKTVVFAMRTSATDAHNIYTLGVDGTGLKQLTTDKSAGLLGRVVGNFAPVFGPGGGFVDHGASPAERVYFSSTRGGALTDIFDTQNADLFAMNVDGEHVEQLTWTVVPEVTPSFLATGEFAGTMAYTLQRSAEGGFKGVLFRFPIDHNAEFHIQPEAHPHFGMSEPPQVFYRVRELVDGRATMALLDEGNQWRGGQLAVLERQFAVEVPVGEEAKATLPGFRHALTILSPDATRNGVSAAGFWRDPTPMPDGAIVVAHAATATDLNDAMAMPRTRLVRVTLGEDPVLNRPTLAKTEVLQDDPAMAWSQPVAAYARPAEDPPHPRKWNDTSATALLVHSGVQVIEAVLAQLPPLGPRPLREDIAFVRAVVPLAVAAELDPKPVPAADTRWKLEGASTVSLTGRMPLFAAVEIPPAADGSLAAHIPAKVPVRVVTLDKDHLAVGALQHQWYAAAPGERFPVGIPASSYNARCAGCHGALDGKPNSVLQPPVDFITQASVTAALYEAQDRRKPLDLPTVVPGMFVFADFRSHVQPILDAKCASCHGATNPAGGLSLTSQPTKWYSDAYESLLKPGTGSAGGFEYVDALGYRARQSFLAEKIMAREYDAPRAFDKACPPAGSTPLTAEEKATLVRWIEFGAAWVGIPPAAK